MAQNQPKIGMVCNNFIRRSEDSARPYSGLDLNYLEAISANGGTPLLLPTLEEKFVDPTLETLDGLVLCGGGDIDPELFGEEPQQGLGSVDRARDEYEIMLINCANKMGLPILGICRGIQVINVAFGGTIHQDLYSRQLTMMQHSQKGDSFLLSHTILFEEGSILAKWAGKAKVRVNSYHHQAVNRVGSGLRVTGKAKDGIVEAVEGTGTALIIGVQFHPERTFRDDFFSKQIFGNFILEASRTSKASAAL